VTVSQSESAAKSAYGDDQRVKSCRAILPAERTAEPRIVKAGDTVRYSAHLAD
jgi:hypothetical protein